jgi:hypothetical protein
VSLSSGDEVPHIFTRKSRLQPGEFLITSAKGLLQHNLPMSDIPTTVARRYKLPVNRSITSITELVDLESRGDTMSRSDPNCDPSSGRTMRRPISIAIP